MNYYKTPSTVDSQVLENQRNHLKQVYEAEYAALIRNNEKFNFKFWQRKDEVRYFNELLNELEAENQKPCDYPKISDKIFLILAVSTSFYISAPPSDETIYGLVSVCALLFCLYFVIRESVIAGCVGRSLKTLAVYYLFLNIFFLKDLNRDDNIVKYQEIKLRILALDNRQNVWKITLLVFDLLFHVVLFILTVVLWYTRQNVYNFKLENRPYPDAFMYFFICVLSIIFTSLYLLMAVGNWNWVRHSKFKLINCS